MLRHYAKAAVKNLIRYKQYAIINVGGMALGIATLVQLTKFSKTEWVSFINEHDLPISYSQRDSSRNLIGKIMSHLAAHQDALDRVSRSIDSGTDPSSKRLNEALRVLLKKE